jgi:ABC-type tungstate transport system permease subunit
MKRLALLSLSLLLALSLLSPAVLAKDKPKLVLATTTSTMDSGLLVFMVPR